MDRREQVRRRCTHAAGAGKQPSLPMFRWRSPAGLMLARIPAGVSVFVYLALPIVTGDGVVAGGMLRVVSSACT